MNERTLQVKKNENKLALVMKLVVIASALFPLSSTSASTSVDQPVCCDSGVKCEEMINSLQASCNLRTSSLKATCIAMKGIVSYEWLLNSRDLSPLLPKQKDLAGTYQLKVGKNFGLTNKWKTTDAPGIEEKEKMQNDIKLRRLCYDRSGIELFGTVGVLFFKEPFALKFQTEVVKVGGISGYFVSGGSKSLAGDFFFYPVTADRQIITSF